MRFVFTTVTALILLAGIVGAQPKKKARRKRPFRNRNKRTGPRRPRRPSTNVLPAPATLDDDGTTCLIQADFAEGTVILYKSGVYKLCEDITFDPTPPFDGPPAEDIYDAIFPSVYDENAFGMGFFSAIAIAGVNIVLDLNGFTIEQSKSHALMQRYFAVIELADAPFIRNQGPAQFVGDVLHTARAVTILGPGTIGRSSHHAIHGNENVKVSIQGVTFRDFEVAAVSVNNVDGLVVQDCTVLNNRQDVPVHAMFSAARFIRPYGKVLKDMDFSMTLRGETASAVDAYDNLIEAINNVYHDVITEDKGQIDSAKHKMEYELFNNEFRTIDGPCYAFVVHGKGPAVGGQGLFFARDKRTTSSNILIRNNTISDMKCWTKEIPAVVEEGIVMNDARGAVFQVVDAVDNRGISVNTDGTYKGNVVSDMQIMVAKAIEEGLLEDDPLLQTGVSTINPTIMAWAESDTGVLNPSFRCNGDAMHHVSKGIVVIRVEDTKGFIIEDNSIESVENLSPQPFANCFDYHAGASDENEGEQQAGNIRGISVAAVRGFRRGFPSAIGQNSVKDLKSPNANAIIGIDIQGDSKMVHIENNTVDLSPDADLDVFDEYIALRIRENVDVRGFDAVTVGENKLSQDEQFVNNRRELRKEPKPGHNKHHLEWNLGGCPFARAQGQMRR